MKIAIILGTRPEIIKMSSIIRGCERRGLDYYILHTGQHYSFEMDRVFFEELNLPAARYNLDVGSGTHAQQILHEGMKLKPAGARIVPRQKKMW